MQRPIKSHEMNTTHQTSWGSDLDGLIDDFLYDDMG